jgi:hypothetical protein
MKVSQNETGMSHSYIYVSYLNTIVSQSLYDIRGVSKRVRVMYNL